MSRDPLIGRMLSNYRLERLIGRGGMASVYLARDVSLQRPIAVKVMAERYRDNPGFAQRFVSEARAVATWRHEHIVQVYHADREDDLSFFAMEYVDGLDLAALLRVYAGEGELMPLDDVVQIGRAVASALDYAHTRGVIHRDVKPSNVMISTEDRVVLTDFGLALDTAQGSLGEVFGTPHYIAPEQARRSADAVPQSDLYSLGVMLYEMLTGAVPFDDPSPAAVALQHLTQPPPPPRSRNPALNVATEQVLLKALSKQPDSRFANGASLMDALDVALHEPAFDGVLDTLDVLEFGESETTGRLLSTRSVAERVALYTQAAYTAERPEEARIPATARGADTPSGHAAVSAPPAPPATAPERRRRRTAVLSIPVLIVLVIAVAAAVASGRQPPPVELVVVSSLTSSPEVSSTPAPPTRTLGVVIVLATPEFTPAPATLTPTTVPPTFAASATPIPATATFQPATATQVPPSATPAPPTSVPASETPSETEASAPISAVPTDLFPNGSPLTLIWDEDSFYWRNPTSASKRLNDIAFEALDAAGNPLPFAFNGLRWTQFYNRVEPGDCAAIEITQSSPLFPPQCRAYNARLTLPRADAEVFWLQRDGAVQFRVLWQGQEIGRCPLVDGACEVRTP